MLSSSDPESGSGKGLVSTYSLSDDSSLDTTKPGGELSGGLGLVCFKNSLKKMDGPCMLLA